MSKIPNLLGDDFQTQSTSYSSARWEIRWVQFLWLCAFPNAFTLEHWSEIHLFIPNLKGTQSSTQTKTKCFETYLRSLGSCSTRRRSNHIDPHTQVYDKLQCFEPCSTSNPYHHQRKRVSVVSLVSKTWVSNSWGRKCRFTSASQPVSFQPIALAQSH